MACGLWVLLLAAAVAVATPGTPCDPDKYEHRGLCCDLCLAGSYVSRDCDMDRVTECHLCEPGSFTAHPNRETKCLLCAECREDQELVSDCTQDSNRRCQCKSGSFYCDSEDCVETCHRCSRCDGPTLEPCNATRDTICATERNAEPGDPPSHHTNSGIWALVVVVLVTGVAIVTVFYRKQGVQLPHLVVRWLKNKSRDSGDPSQGGTQHRVILLPRDAECGPPAPDPDSPLLLGHQGSAVAPSEDPEGGVELQVMVTTRSRAALEQALQTQAPVPPRGPDQAGATATLHALQQQYEQEYVLKDESPEAMNRIYFEFGQEVHRNNWRMFMRLAGLEENDIVICEHENPGNLTEQHHRMLLRWQSRLGRAASPFRLMAVLSKMGLRECLQNVINKLVAENILGSKDAEPPN